jgi:peptidoglycan hydrolase-like protein with peptidoglycan-binding domain
VRIDGVNGFRTREAIKQFEESQSGIPDGLLSSDLVQRARIAVKEKGGG